jgi:hypothetical protein
MVNRTAVPIRYVDYSQTGFDASDDARDIRWVQERTTELLLSPARFYRHFVPA